MNLMPTGSQHLLDIKELSTHFHIREGVLKAVDKVSFFLDSGEIVGIVGESGCGKSVLAHSIMRLMKSPPAQCTGNIEFKGVDLLQISQNDMRKVRGKQISMIFQDSLVSLNPVLKIGRQISEVLMLHQNLNKAQARNRSIELLELMQIPNPENRYNQYIFQLSGGMRQRVMIAMGLSCQPDILLADEPTTALDVTVQAQILELIKEMNQRLGTAVVLVTHDLGIVAGYTKRVMVFYAGKIVEVASTKTVFKDPRHPYTLGLIGAVPQLTDDRNSHLANISGSPPSLVNPADECAFFPRCTRALDKCRTREPELEEIAPNHMVRCYNPFDHSGKTDA